MSKVAKATIGLMIATMIAKILGFVRELVLASSYGLSIYSDAYITALNIPLVIFTVIGTTLGTVLIPMYFEIERECGQEESMKYINNVFNIVIILCALLAILGLIFTEELVKVFAVGFKGETLKLTLDFTKIIIVGIIFTGLSYIMTAFLQIKDNFAIPGITSVPKNIIIIVSIVLSVKNNPYIMIWGALIGSISEFLFQLPFALKNGYKYRFYIDLKDKYIKKTIILIGPVLIGVSVNQLNTMIDRTLGSTLSKGSISALNYANKLNLFVMALFILSISAVVYPKLSKLSQDNKESFFESIVQSINTVILLVMPISVGAIVLSKPIVKILFERGQFNQSATSMTAIVLVMYSIGMVTSGLREILSRIFYSLKDTKTPMKNGIITVIVNILLNIILIKYFKIAGLALATSLSSTVCTLLLFRSLKKRLGDFGQDKIINTTFKSIISSILMGFITRYIYSMLIGFIGSGILNELISLFISVGIGALSYLILIIIFKVNEINMIVNMLKSRLQKVV